MKSTSNALKQIFLLGMVITLFGCAHKSIEHTQAPTSRIDSTSSDPYAAERTRFSTETEEGWAARTARRTDYPLAEVEDRAPASIDASAGEPIGFNERTSDVASEDQASRGGGFSWILIVAALILAIYLGAKMVLSRRNSPKGI